MLSILVLKCIMYYLLILRKCLYSDSNMLLKISYICIVSTILMNFCNIFNNKYFKIKNGLNEIIQHERMILAARVRLSAKSGILISTLELDVCPLSMFCPLLFLAMRLHLLITDSGKPALGSLSSVWFKDSSFPDRQLTHCFGL